MRVTSGGVVIKVNNNVNLMIDEKLVVGTVSEISTRILPGYGRQSALVRYEYSVNVDETEYQGEIIKR